LPFTNKPRNTRLEKLLRQPVQFPQPRRVEHPNRALHYVAAKHIRRVGADRARRAIRQVYDQQQRAVPPLKRPRRQ
jgi:hypothetical protein